jgi:hypothetical protein
MRKVTTFAAAFFLASPALAEDARPVDGFVSVTKTCKALRPPEVSVVVAPERGEAIVGPSPVEPRFSKESPFFMCNGASRPGTALWYRPKLGDWLPTRLMIRIRFENGDVEYRSYAAVAGQVVNIASFDVAKFQEGVAAHFKRCWLPPTQPAHLGYMPEIAIDLNVDGSLAGEPRLIGAQPPDAGRRGRAASALHSVRKCSPMPVSKEDAAFYDYWKSISIRFDASQGF